MTDTPSEDGIDRHPLEIIEPTEITELSATSLLQSQTTRTLVVITAVLIGLRRPISYRQAMRLAVVQRMRRCLGTDRTPEYGSMRARALLKRACVSGNPYGTMKRPQHLYIDEDLVFTEPAKICSYLSLADTNQLCSYLLESWSSRQYMRSWLDDWSKHLLKGRFLKTSMIVSHMNGIFALIQQKHDTRSLDKHLLPRFCEPVYARKLRGTAHRSVEDTYLGTVLIMYKLMRLEPSIYGEPDAEDLWDDPRSFETEEITYRLLLEKCGGFRTKTVSGATGDQNHSFSVRIPGRSSSAACRPPFRMDLSPEFEQLSASNSSIAQPDREKSSEEVADIPYRRYHRNHGSESRSAKEPKWFGYTSETWFRALLALQAYMRIKKRGPALAKFQTYAHAESVTYLKDDQEVVCGVVDWQLDDQGLDSTR